MKIIEIVEPSRQVSCFIINEQPQQHFIEFSYTILYYISHFSNENIKQKTENVKCNIFFL